MTAKLTIGTRGSPLARVQTDDVARRLKTARPELAEPGALKIKIISTTGDKVQDRPLAEIGGKGLFTKEIEEALLDSRIDLAVHSMKDVETVLPKGLRIAAILPREDPRDVLIAGDAMHLADLRQGARVGTASLRRRAQLLALRPDLEVTPFRGNVDTRLRKLADGVVDATILALAGLRRLGREGYESRAIAIEEMLPAVAQGAVGIECRESDEDVMALLAGLEDAPSAREIACERALLVALDGSCHTPIAGLARAAGDQLELSALIATPDGVSIHRARRTGSIADAEALGRDAGIELRAAGGPGFFA
ncbi:MAG: hydroxymethylbilane synthase [Alphaproteobacteria bacterium]|nr:hydroxymethylbilane synthase [Alphaproteobacteria bacterium]